MTFSPPLPTPMTYDRWMEITQSLDECIPARNIIWLFSLVSTHGDRSVCVYQIPYAEAVGEAYREARMEFQRIWHGSGIPAIPQPNPDGLVTLVEVGAAACPQSDRSSEAAAPDLLPSVVLSNGERTILLFTAAIETVRSDYANANPPCQCLWQAILIHPPT